MQTVYGILNFEGYEHVSNALHDAVFTQFVDNPEMDKDSLEYKMFGYGQLRTIRVRIPVDYKNFDVVIKNAMLGRVLKYISYSPIITSQLKTAMTLKLKTIETIKRDQLLMIDDSIFVDQYGLPVYAQNILVVDDVGLYDQDLRFIEDYSKVFIEGNVHQLLS